MSFTSGAVTLQEAEYSVELFVVVFFCIETSQVGMHGGSYPLGFWLTSCTIPDIANTLHSLEHAIRPRLLPTVTAINREVFALFLHFTIPNTHTDEPQTFNPSSPQHSNFNPSRTLNSRTNYMETTNPTTIQQIQKGYSRIRRSGDTYP